jgi:hypothetical protein
MPAGGQLTEIRIGFASGSPQVYTKVPEIFEMGQLPERIRERVESTIFGVTGDRTYISGLSDVQDLIFTVRLNMTAGSVHEQIRTLQFSKAERWWRIEATVDSDYSTNKVWAWNMLGEVASCVVSPPKDGLKTMEVTVLHKSDLFIQPEMTSLLI